MAFPCFHLKRSAMLVVLSAFALSAPLACAAQNNSERGEQASGEAGASEKAAALAKKVSQVSVFKATPILFADDIRACLDFWAGFGLQPSITIPDQDGVGFAIVGNDAIEIMYQSFANAKAQRPEVIEGINRSMVYLEVASLDAILPHANNFEIVVPAHMTDYGSRELYVRDPAGNLIGFAEQNAR